MAEIIDMEQTDMWPARARRRTVPTGYLDPSFVVHAGKMVVSCLWRGDARGMEMYAGILMGILGEAPWLEAALEQPFRRQVVKVLRCLEEGSTPTPWTPHEDRWSGSVAVPPCRNEAGVVAALASDQSLLRPITGGGAVRNLVCECPAGGGRADMRFQVGRIVHVVEVKAVAADHKVVGQVQKYIRDIGGLVHQGTHDDVSGWVVAPDVGPEAALELMMCGVRMVRLRLQ